MFNPTFVLALSLLGSMDAGVDDAGLEPAPPADGERLFSPDHVLQVRLDMDQGDWDRLRHQSRRVEDLLGPGCEAGVGPSPYTYFEADAVIDGETLPRVGVRAKGLVGSIEPAKPSLKIKFDEYIDDVRLDGRKRMTLNNAAEDSSFIRTCLGYQVFQSMGVPAPRCNFAHVFVNDQDLGIYVHVEPIKKPFLRRHFESDDGNLYEGFVSDFGRPQIPSFEQKTNENSDPGRADLRAVAEALGAEDDRPLAALDDVVDLPAFFRFWAAEIIVAHWDGYVGATNNFYVYFAPPSGKLQLLPWGAENIFRAGRTGGLFSQHTEGEMRANGLLAWHLYRHPEGRERFLGALQDAMAIWDEASLLASIDDMVAVLRPELDDDGVESLLSRVQGTRSFITSRRVVMDRLIDDPPDWEHPAHDRIRCWEPAGELDITFQTNWTTEDFSDLPFGHGSGEAQGDVRGDIMATTVDVQIGQKGDDRPDLQLVSPLPGGGFFLITASPTRHLLERGEPIQLETVVDSALVAAVTPTLEVDWFGAFYEGTLEFDQLGFADGDAVSGRLSGRFLGPVLVEDDQAGCSCTQDGHAGLPWGLGGAMVLAGAWRRSRSVRNRQRAA